jgi:hypothetical protein
MPQAMVILGAAVLRSVYFGLYLGVLPSSVGYVTYAHMQSRMPAGRAASFLYLVPGYSQSIDESCRLLHTDQQCMRFVWFHSLNVWINLIT